jgi:hypothetical protein
MEKKVVSIKIVSHTPHSGTLQLNRWYYDKIGQEYVVTWASPLYYAVHGESRPARILKSDCEILF